MVVALTTVDNPFNPLTQFDDWFSYDTMKGYNSCGYLARVARTSPDVAPIENELAIERAVDEIIRFDPFGIYRKVIEDENNAPRGG